MTPEEVKRALGLEIYQALHARPDKDPRRDLQAGEKLWIAAAGPMVDYLYESGSYSSITLQQVTDNGATTTNAITVSTSGSSFNTSKFISNIDMVNHRITNVVDPVNNQDAATKKYVDTQVGVSDTLDGVVKSGSYTNHGIQVDASGSRFYNLAITSGSLEMFNHKIIHLATPTNDYDGATKLYVDTISGSIGTDIASNYATKDYVNNVSGSIGDDLNHQVLSISGSIGQDLNHQILEAKHYTDTVSGSIGDDLNHQILEARHYTDQQVGTYDTLDEIVKGGSYTNHGIQVDASGSAFYNLNITSGSLDMVNHRVVNTTDPISNQDAATKHYVDIHNNAMSGSFGYYYNVMDYGAMGDGTTDDQAAIQSAITAAGNAGGGTVIFPEGTYLVGDTLTVPNNVKLIGVGAGSIIKAKDALDKDIITITDKSGVDICYLKIDGNKANNTGPKTAIIFKGASGSRVLNVEIVNMYGQSIGIGTEGNPSNNITIENNTITGGNSNHIDVNSSQNIRIRNNHIIGNLGGECGIFLGHAKTQDHLVEGNYITAANWGIVIDNSAFNAEQTDARRIRVIGNYFSGSQTSGITLYGAQHCVIANNECVSNNASNVGDGSGSGIFLTDGNSRGASYNVITGNRCYDAQSPKLQAYGIFTALAADYNYITGNNLEGNLTGELSLVGSNNIVYGSDAIVANLKSNSNIYVNYDGGDTESYLYFYDNSSPTDAYLRWYDSLSRFHFNKPLAITGNIEAWNGSVLSQGHMYVNQGGPADNSYFYFYTNSLDDGAWLGWDEAITGFKFSHDLSMNVNQIHNLASPSGSWDAANKSYVDAVSGSIGDDLNHQILEARYYTDTVSGSIGDDLNHQILEARHYTDTVSGSIGDDLNHQVSNVKAYTDTASGSCAQSLQGVTNVGNTTTKDITVANLKSNSNIYVNYDGADADSYLYFYDNSSPTDAYLRWYDSLSRFHFNKPLAITGNIEAWSGDIFSQGEIYINSGGPDGDSYLYFYENSSDLGAYLQWDEAKTGFKFSHGIEIESLEINQTPVSGSITPTVYITLTVQQADGTDRTIRIAGEMV